jgi:hypothetical protein
MDVSHYLQDVSWYAYKGYAHSPQKCAADIIEWSIKQIAGHQHTHTDEPNKHVQAFSRC